MGALGDGFERLVEVVRRLRAPDGCPWDRAQTHASLRRYALEEAREVADAITVGDVSGLRAELGDLLLQVCLHAVIAEESGAFGPEAVVEDLTAKLIRRHPHVFDSAPAAGVQDVERLWAEAKRAEAGGGGGQEPWLRAVPRDLPALAEALALGRRAAEVGFDWPEAAQAWPKVAEESAELRKAWASWEAAGRPAGGAAEVEAETGDVLFAVANVARLLGLDPEAALLLANARFRRRFAAIEANLPGGPGTLRAAGLPALEAAWQRAKGAEGDMP